MALTIYEQQPIVLTEDAWPVLREMLRTPTDQWQFTLKLVGPKGEEIPLPPPLVDVLQSAARILLQGEGIVIIPADRELTTQEAADFLNMSRQYLVQILERGEIPFTKTGTHRRVKFRDLLTYREHRDACGREILDELTRLGQEMGDYATSG